MSLANNKSVHITLFKEKESFFKRSFNKHILLIFNNLTIFLIFLKIHAQFFNLSLILTQIFYFSLNFYYKYNNSNISKFNLKFYKHYFFVYFNLFFNKLMKTSLKIKNLIDLFFIKFFNKIKKINSVFNKKLFILYNFNIFLIGKNYNVYTGNIIPFYQKKLMWFIGTGLKMDGECSESVLNAEEYNKLIWSNFEKNSIIKIKNFSLNLTNYKIHTRLKNYYYLYLNFTFKYVKLQKTKFIKTSKNISYFTNFNKFYKNKQIKSSQKNYIKQIKNFSYNFFINLFTSLVYTFKSFYNVLHFDQKKMNLFFYFLNSFFIYLKSIFKFIKLIKQLKDFSLNTNTNLPFIINKFYSINLLNSFFFNNLFENKKLFFLFFTFFIKKKLKIKKAKIYNYYKLLNRISNLNLLKKQKFKFFNRLKSKKFNFKIFNKFKLNLLLFNRLKKKVVKKNYKFNKLKSLKIFKNKLLLKKKKYKTYIKFKQNKLKKKNKLKRKYKIIHKRLKITKKTWKRISRKKQKILQRNKHKKKKRFDNLCNHYIKLFRKLNKLKKLNKLNKLKKKRKKKLNKKYKLRFKLLIAKYRLIARKFKQLIIKKKKYIKFRNRVKQFKFLENKELKNFKKTKCKRKTAKLIRLKIFSRLNLIRLKKFKFKKKHKKRIRQFSWSKNFITQKINSKFFIILNKRKNLLSRLEKNKYNYVFQKFDNKYKKKKTKIFLKKKVKKTKLLKFSKNKLKKFIKVLFIRKNKTFINFFNVLNKKLFYMNNILNKKYLNIIIATNYNKFIFFKKIELILFNNLYFFKIFSIFSFLFKLNFFFKNILIKKYEFFYYYKNFYIFEELLDDLNEFNLIFKNNKFNFIYIYKIIFEKILLIEFYLKQFFFILIKIKKNCFKYKYFFFNIIKYLIILKKKYLYLTTLDFFVNIIEKKYLLSEKFNIKLMTLCTLKKKCLLNLKKKLKKKHHFFLIKKKTKKYFGYIVRNLKKTKNINLK